jgi:recombination protein RecT
MSNELKTTATASPVAAFSKTLDRMKSQMALALPKHMSADRMARLALTAFSTNKDLQACRQETILASLMTATQLGLEPGINGQGYLIPYKGTCTFVPGWKGLVDLVSRAGRATVWTGAVYAGDHFDYQLGDEPFCRHKPDDGEGEFTHVYAIGRVKDAQMPVIEVWSRKKVQKHLAQYNKVGNRHYALSSESNFEMYARKVALLQVLKYMPSSIELANAIEVSHAAEAGQGAVIEGDFVTVSSEPVDQTAGEIKPDDQQQQEGKLPGLDAESFAKKLAAWRKPVDDGKQSVDDVLAFARSKFMLSPEQTAEIEKLRATTQAAGQEGGAA